jgi:thiol-disulfide isomerase/thioredoxin
MKLLFTRPSLIIFLFIYFPAIAFAQTQLTIVLKTSTLIDSAMVVNFTGKEVYRLPFKDTLTLDFIAKGDDFYHVNFVQKEKIFNEKFYLNNGNITILMRIENNKLFTDTVIGSPMFDTVKAWKKKYATLIQSKDSSALDSFLLKSYESQIENMFSFHIGMAYLNFHKNEKEKLYALLPLVARQTNELKKQFGYSILNNQLQGIIKNNVVSLSDFDLINTASKQVRPAVIDSQVVVLDFWFVGCIPCMEDHQKIKKLLPTLKEKQVALISISNDDSFEKWKDYLNKHNYSWLHYKKPAAAENIITQLGISIYPTYMLLNKKKEIVFYTHSLEEVLKKL